VQLRAAEGGEAIASSRE